MRIKLEAQAPCAGLHLVLDCAGQTFPCPGNLFLFLDVVTSSPVLKSAPGQHAVSMHKAGHPGMGLGRTHKVRDRGAEGGCTGSVWVELLPPLLPGRGLVRNGGL